MKLSIAIITLNEERNIGDCIASVKEFADEIVVVDSFSSDRTAEIAHSFGAKVHTHEFLGDGGQKRLATSLCSNDWVFCIDADERLTNPEKFRSLLNNARPEFQYAVKRANHILNRRVRFGRSYPDYVTRLFNKNTAGYILGEHASVQGAKTATTSVELLHYTHPKLETLYRKMIHYAEWAANETPSSKPLRSSLVSGLWTFIRLYLLNAGFLDGRPGLHWATAAAFRSFLKHEMIRERNGKL